jgi:hypothetical protein
MITSITLKSTGQKAARYRGTVLVETAIVMLLTTNLFPDKYTAFGYDGKRRSLIKNIFLKG